jgi:uncharacterized protein (TIGR03083 family)
MLRRVNDHESHIAAAEEELARFVEATARADLATPVPTCPGWTLADLVGHEGAVVRWITEIVRTLPAERIPDVEPPGDPEEYAAWLADAVEPLLTTLRATPADAPVWTFGADGHVRFWSRRVLYETVIHRADVELALGRVPVIDRDRAAGGVEEFLDAYPPHPRVAARIADFGRFGDTLHLHATDGDGEWTITLTPDGTRWERGHRKATVAARGTAADLLLCVYGRYSPDRLEVFGDEALLSGWLAAAAPQ